MDKIKIIVVEDNIVYCEFVCNLLAREGFRTVQAFHLSTARKLLQQAADGDIVVRSLWWRFSACCGSATCGVLLLGICGLRSAVLPPFPPP